MTEPTVAVHPPVSDEAGRSPGSTSSPIAPALLLGVGLGGFIDGIVLHQILQWHHMLTATDGYPATTVAGLEDNTQRGSAPVRA